MRPDAMIIYHGVDSFKGAGSVAQSEVVESLDESPDEVIAVTRTRSDKLLEANTKSSCRVAVAGVWRLWWYVGTFLLVTVA